MPRPPFIVPEELKDPARPSGIFSHSQYNRYKACPRSYEFRYVQGLKVPPGAAMFRGTVVHAGAEAAHRHILETKALPQLPAMQAVVSDAFEHGKDEVEDWGDDKPGALKDGALSLYAKYHVENLPHLRPVAVEEGFAARVGLVPVMGFFDLIERHTSMTTPSANDPEVVVDLKTSSAKWSADDIRRNTQLTLYSIVRKTPFVRVDNLVQLKAGPALHRLESTRTSVDQRNLTEDLEETVDLVKKGVFPKTAIDGWACCPKWCGYWSRCRGR